MGAPLLLSGPQVPRLCPEVTLGLVCVKRARFGGSRTSPSGVPLLSPLAGHPRPPPLSHLRARGS